MYSYTNLRFVQGCICGIFFMAAIFIINQSVFKDSSPYQPKMTHNVPSVSLIGMDCSKCIKKQVRDNIGIEPSVRNLVRGLVDLKVDADSPQLVEVIRSYFIDEPRPYITKFSIPMFQTLQAETVYKILNKENGFFIECGALDGERSSNTNWLEQTKDWQGLLIEMDPSYYMQLRGKNRKCYSINACLSPEQHPTIMSFKADSMGQGKVIMSDKKEDTRVHETYCFPFLSLMLALNRTKIDYFSLDVEGMEMSILYTIPFDKIDISVFTIEYIHQPSTQVMINFMKGKGYYLHSQLDSADPAIHYYCRDYVFVKNNI